MDERLQHARSHRFVEFGVLANEAVDKYKGTVPKSLRRKLESYRLPFKAATADPVIGEVAECELEKLEYLLEYLDTQDQQALKKSEEAHKKGDKITWRILSERWGNNGI